MLEHDPIRISGDDALDGPALEALRERQRAAGENEAGALRIAAFDQGLAPLGAWSSITPRWHRLGAGDR